MGGGWELSSNELKRVIAMSEPSTDMIPWTQAWAKIDRAPDGKILHWHSLVDHSTDVAAVLRALLALPTIRRRLACALGLADLDPVQIERLAALAMLHDAGKANRGFQARRKPDAPLIGHVEPLAWLMERGGELAERLIDTLGLERMDGWFAGSTGEVLLEILLAHHGRPIRPELPDAFRFWCSAPDGDPIACLDALRRTMDLICAPAFAEALPIIGTTYFDHAFAGLLMLADWIGSDTQFFPMRDGLDAARPAETLSSAREALRAIGLDVEARREACRRQDADFASLFNVSAARPIQRDAITPKAQCVVLEAETGSGKTEAALWRFVDLFRRGEVDGLYFALPTRVAATQMFGRIKKLRDRLFPADDRPAVVLAVPGQAAADEATLHPLPDFGFEWDDAPGTGERAGRWAAEHPKRFLAAQIAVGTIDQALLAAIQTKHAHLRGTALLRHLLVVDEVHASDRFQELLLANLLDGHLQAGGHALLLSATLGAAARARLLGVARCPLGEAEAVAYPALSWAEAGKETVQAVSACGSSKTVALEASSLIDDPAAIAALARAAAADGAKVLVIRNTVGAAIATQLALEAEGETSALFRVNGRLTLHHGRFATNDRRLLDAAVEAAFGKESPREPRVLIGTQTLEISLDLDADLLITDLCPVDVLLQRIGRLHRHAGRTRPLGYTAPRVVVLTPTERNLWTTLRRGGHGLRHVYPDPRIIEATWRLIEAHPRWDIPVMNRFLVERATHPDALAPIEAAWRAADPAWRKLLDEALALSPSQIQQARLSRLDRGRPFSDFCLPSEDSFATRLGARDRMVDFAGLEGPFGTPIGKLRVPQFLAPDAGEAEAEIVSNSGEGLVFRLGASELRYGRMGLERASSNE